MVAQHKGGLIAGFYFVEFVLPAERLFSPQHMGSDRAIDSDANVETGGTQVFFLPPFFTDDTLDAGIYDDERENPTGLEQTEEPELLNSKLYLPVVGRKGAKKTAEGMSDSDIAALNVRWGVELAQ